MSIKIAIADDHALIAEGISKMLARYPNIEIGTHYPTGATLLEGLKTEQPDVLLLDIHFPDMTGNELARLIVPLYPDMKIVVLTSVDDPHEVQDMLQQGCLGYVQKTVSSGILAQAIETVYRGERFLEASVKEGLVEAMLETRPKGASAIQLNSREQEILELVCEGYTNIDIGEKLFLSHRTVEKYKMALYQKFEVNNAVRLAKVAAQYKFIK